MKTHAEIVDTQTPLYFKAQIEINAPANEIFDFITQPKNHPLMDGSGMVKGRFNGPEKFYLGAKFGMKMRIGIPYVISNQVVEYEENWAMLGAIYYIMFGDINYTQ